MQPKTKMSDFIQDDLNVNLNSVAQVLADVTIDYVVSKQLLPMLGVDMELSMLESTVFHVADEIVFPALIEALDSILEAVPLVGGWLQKMLAQYRGRTYVKVVLRLILIGFIQKTFSGRTDVLSGAVMFLSTYSVNYGAEIKAVKKVLDWEIDF